MHLSKLAAAQPNKAAVIIGSDGSQTTFAELDERSRRLAQALASRGLRAGDHLAILVENRAAFLEAAWAAQRSGLYYTPVNWHLSAAEAVYIVGDCDARALVASHTLGSIATAVAAAGKLDVRLSVGGPMSGFEEYERVLGEASSEPLPDEREGAYMFYSSGTTGRPKGIKPALSGAPFGTGLTLDAMLPRLYGFGPDSVYLCTGPLYHAAPLGWSLGTQRNGGSVVVMDRFDAESALALIERHRVTHAQFVPTMFVRMLKLPEEVRRRYDLSSLRAVVHAAAPCPIPVKEAIIEWLGPIVSEYYSGSEGNCFFAIDSPTWLAHKGSVGKATMGTVHILDEDGQELPTGEVGTIWIAGTVRFEYHNDAEKTAGAFNDRGWSTLGDLGHVDDEGYLYLSDRRADLILSGGVNIYPQEVEEVLALHPAVVDVAVIGVDDEEMGQRVKAVVQLEPPAIAGPALEAELIAYCRDRIAHFKCPRSIDFADVPRLPSGKVLRREVRDRYQTSPAASVT
ncbi:MAG: acyl-CoA synthetase [Mycobacterium sp.]|nr:acyl-CoA synthetase [Mycobacterium sp.]